MKRSAAIVLGRPWSLSVSAVGLAIAIPLAAAEPAPPFRIQVVDAENGWPVPLAMLRTVHEVVEMFGATSEGRPFDSLEPPLRPRFDFYRGEAGVPRAIAEIEGRGPTWINGLASLPDAGGREHLVGFYVKVEPPLTVYRCGLCVWDEEAERFVEHRVLWDVERGGETPLEILPGHPAPESVPRGHPVRWTDAEGEAWMLFGDPKVHAGWVDDGSPALFFEGTYTKTFSRNAPATPRHDYNQVLYRFDLDDPALAPARGAGEEGKHED